MTTLDDRCNGTCDNCNGELVSDSFSLYRSEHVVFLCCWGCVHDYAAGVLQ